MRANLRLPLSLITLLLVSTAAWAADKPKDDLQARRDALNKLLAEQWEYNLSTSPEFASILGDKRWNDQISDFSQAAIDADLAKSREFLTRFEAIDTTGFPEQEALNKELMVRGLKEGIEGARFKGWLMPVTQISGIHLMVPQFPPLLSFTTVKDYDDLITRYRKIPRVFDQTIGHMRAGMAAGLMPPKFLLEKVVGQVEGIAAMSPSSRPSPSRSPSSPRTSPRPSRSASARRCSLRSATRSSRPTPVRQVREGGVPRPRAAPSPACGPCPTARPATPGPSSSPRPRS